MSTQKRLAVLVGCCYANSENEVHGSREDVNTMEYLLIHHFNFKRGDITILAEEPPSQGMPTKANIMRALDEMIPNEHEQAILFFYFSGSGKLVSSNNPGIISSDDDTIDAIYFRQLVDQLPNGVSFTFVCEAHHSGGLVVNEKQQFPEQGSNSHPEPVCSNNGILLSACQMNELAARITNVDPKKASGAFTRVIRNLFNSNTQITNRKLVEGVAQQLRVEKFKQVPGLYCSDGHAEENFLDI